MPWPIVLASWVALAEPRLPLSWSAPPSCPDDEEVHAELGRLVGTLNAPTPSLRFDARVRPVAERYELELRSSDPTTPTRTLDAHDCETLASAAVLVVAIELDPVRATAAVPVQRPTPPAIPEPTLAPAPNSSPRPQPPDPAPPELDEPRDAEATGRDRPRALQAMLRAHGGGGWMGLPRVGPLVGGAAGLGWPRFRAEVLGELQPRQLASYADGTGAELRMASGGIRACPTMLRGSVEVPLCAGAWLGALRGRGRGVSMVREATDTWVAAEAHVGLAWSPVPRIALRAGLGGTVALRRPAFFLQDHPVLFRTPRFGGRFTVGIESRFPGRGRTESARRGD